MPDRDDDTHLAADDDLVVLDLPVLTAHEGRLLLLFLDYLLALIDAGDHANLDDDMEH